MSQEDSSQDKKQPRCWGCRSPFQPNQLAHMDPGGCLYDPEWDNPFLPYSDYDEEGESRDSPQPKRSPSPLIPDLDDIPRKRRRIFPPAELRPVSFPPYFPENESKNNKNEIDFVEKYLSIIVTDTTKMELNKYANMGYNHLDQHGWDSFMVEYGGMVNNLPQTLSKEYNKEYNTEYLCEYLIKCIIREYYEKQ